MLKSLSKISPLIVIGICVSAITFVTFLPTLRLGFVMWDDDISITRNSLIQSLDGYHLIQMFKVNPDLLKYAPFYWVSLGITYFFSGLDPFGYHLGNLLFHVSNATLCFYILFRIFLMSPKIEKPEAVRAAFFSSLFWAVHPLRVDVVALSSNRSYCQAVFFILLSFLFYLVAMSREGIEKPIYLTSRYWLSILFLLISLLSFPVGLCFIVVFIGFDYYYLNGLQSRIKTLLIEKIPIVAVTTIILALNLLARVNPQGIRADQQFSSLSIHQTMKAFYMWAFYFWKPWVPFFLSPVNPVLIQSSPQDFHLVLSAFLIISLSVFLFLLRKRFLGLFTLWLIHLFILLPVLGLTETIHYPAERYSYLQGLLWSVAIGWVLSQFYKKTKLKIQIGVSYLFSSAIIAILICLTVPQISIWRNSITLFEHILHNLQGNTYCGDIYWRLGKVYVLQGKPEKAIGYFNQTLEIYPGFPIALMYRGFCYSLDEKYELAESDLAEAIKFYPQNEILRFHLADVLSRRGKHDLAKLHFQKLAARGFPTDRYYLRLAWGQTQTGEFEKALRTYSHALVLNPDNIEALKLKSELIDKLKR